MHTSIARNSTALPGDSVSASSKSGIAINVAIGMCMWYVVEAMIQFSGSSGLLAPDYVRHQRVHRPSGNRNCYTDQHTRHERIAAPCLNMLDAQHKQQATDKHSKLRSP
jgi:hypothetical protein